MRGIVYGKDSQIGYSAYHTNFSISTLPFSPGKRTRKNSSFAAHPWVPLVPLSPGIWAAKKPAGLTGRDPLHTQPTIVVNKHPASKPWKHRFPYHLKDVQVWTKSVKKKEPVDIENIARISSSRPVVKFENKSQKGPGRMCDDDRRSQ
jgi:hypothetical protein